MKTLVVIVFALLIAGCGDGDRSTRPTATAGTINCKSPITGLPVTQERAIAQAQRINSKRLALGDSNSVIVTVDCGDDVVVVPVVPPVVVPRGE